MRMPEGQAKEVVPKAAPVVSGQSVVLKQVQASLELESPKADQY